MPRTVTPVQLRERAPILDVLLATHTLVTPCCVKVSVLTIVWCGYVGSSATYTFLKPVVHFGNVFLEQETDLNKIRGFTTNLIVASFTEVLFVLYI